MIEDFAKLIPPSQKDRSGKAFYSGRLAFGKRSDVYVLGLYPGGDPEEYPEETISNHTCKVLHEFDENWSEYRDASWGVERRADPGIRGIQPNLLYLFEKMGMDPGEVPASNLIFQRSTEMPKDYDTLASNCWIFHGSVIWELDVRVVVLFGLTKREFLRKKLNMLISRRKECRSTNGDLISVTYEGHSRTLVVLRHPSRYSWINSANEDDPTEAVLQALGY